MKIRKLNAGEKQKTRPLYEEVFPEDSRGFVDYYYTEKTKDNQIYVVEEAGDIQAMLHLNPYEVMVSGEEKTVHYIVAVATREAFRRRGYMAQLLRRALHDMYEAKETFTFLMPAAEAIYLPHDFRTVYEQVRRDRPEPGEAGEDIKVRPAAEEDCGKLAEAAESYLKARYQIYAKRDAAYYRRLIKECASDGGALLLSLQGGEIADACPSFPPDETETDHRPKIMARIVDVKRMLPAAGLRSLMAACFQVTDPVIEANNCCVVLTGTEYSGVMLMDGEERNSEGVLSIAALTSLIFGAKSVEEICLEEGVRMTERLKGELKKLVPLDRIYLNEVV